MLWWLWLLTDEHEDPAPQPVKKKENGWLLKFGSEVWQTTAFTQWILSPGVLVKWSYNHKGWGGCPVDGSGERSGSCYGAVQDLLTRSTFLAIWGIPFHFIVSFLMAPFSHVNLDIQWDCMHLIQHPSFLSLFRKTEWWSPQLEIREGRHGNPFSHIK